jgi:hypothetical protein
MMVRFANGVPQYVWFSQHANGQAFRYSTVMKDGDRPVGYSANGYVTLSPLEPSSMACTPKHASRGLADLISPHCIHEEEYRQLFKHLELPTTEHHTDNPQLPRHLRHPRHSRPHDPELQPPRRRARRPHRPRHTLGPAVVRLLLLLQRRRQHLHALRQQRHHAHQLAVLHRPMGRPRVPDQRPAPVRDLRPIALCERADGPQG